MTVKELREALSHSPDDWDVLLLSQGTYGDVRFISESIIGMSVILEAGRPVTVQYVPEEE
jgi:hypothetical protein